MLLDDNYEPLRFCNIKNCGIHFIFEDVTIGNIAPEPCSASGLVDSAEQEKEDNKTHGTLKNSFYLWFSNHTDVFLFLCVFIINVSLWHLIYMTLCTQEEFT